MSIRRCLVSAVLWSALSVAGARAQAPEAAGPTVRRAAVSRLPTGTEVRISTDARYLRGPLGVSGMDSIAIRTRDAAVVLPLAAVDTLWVRRGGPDRGAATGVALGGLTLGFWAVVICVEAGCSGGGTVGLTAIGAGLGAGVGGLLGGVAGAVAERWERRFP